MKKNRTILLLMLLLCIGTSAMAQRVMETLDRGLVAVKTNGGVFLSWRIDGTEYYDTEYNIYRDGVLVNESPLMVSNYTDVAGTLNSTYAVSAVVRGTEQTACEAVGVWRQPYLSIPMQKVYSRRGTDITSEYSLNDATAADLDGDGQMELIVKRIYNHEGLFDVANDSAFVHFEAYKLDGTWLWTIDCGPNMISSSHVETNINAFDWDLDGKAELIMRATDGTIVTNANGETYTVGDMKANYRNQISHSSNMTYATAGAEFLLYMEGLTAKLYNKRAFPLPRLESGESTIEAAWGDGYGHRANKFFFGAPYLDGCKPSIFLARGIYTRHRMVAYDVNPETHELTERWRWNDVGGAWWGQGYHNYGIADVDWDGRDEIVYGSMVIDDNGKGLSTTGLGHGDAQHCSDLDPYRKGQEIFACNENAKGYNYRDATTSKLYFFNDIGRDCGRAMAGNFTDSYLGSQMVAVGSGLLSSVVAKSVSDGYSNITQNFRIYWDGDLCSESLDGNGTEGAADIHKFNGGVIYQASGTKMCNWTKNTPSLQADILGDWREEIIARSSDNQSLRVYVSTFPSQYPIYTLLHDMQYRQAVNWQMCGYNQPPHLSYFIGKAEGYTVAPPPVMSNGRVVIEDAITAEHNDQHLLMANPEGGEVSVAEDVQPYILTVNAFSHTTGSNNNNNISTSYSAYTLTGAPFAGPMRLVKQGEGILNLGGNHTYTGETMLWGGVTNFEGELPNSPVVMRRFAELNGNLKMGKNLSMEYGAIIRPGGVEAVGAMSVDSLEMHFGAVAEFDLYADGFVADTLNIKGLLSIEAITRSDAPAYKAPVFRFVQHLAAGEEKMAPGSYFIAYVGEVKGDIEDIIIEGLEGISCVLRLEDGNLYLDINAQRMPATIYWTGSDAESTLWDLSATQNFVNQGQADYFVTGDTVVFDSTATNFTVSLAQELMPAAVVVAGDKAYKISGEAIVGEASLTKRGSGMLTLSNVNKYTGKTILEGGNTLVSSLANKITPNGALGAYSNAAGHIEIRNGAVMSTTSAVTNGTPIRLGEGGGVISNTKDFIMEGAFSGSTLTKRGGGWLKTQASGSGLGRLVITAGTVQNGSGNAAKVVEMQGGSLVDNVGTSNEMHIPEGRTASWTTANRATYTNKITGAGKITIYCATEKGSNWVATRTPLNLNTAEFTGTLVPQATNASDGRFTLNTASNLAQGRMDIPSGIVVQNTGKVYTIGELTGSGSLGGGCTFSNDATVGVNTWKVGSRGTDFTFGGSIVADGTKFEKVGAGTMTVTGASDFTGTAVISEGAVCLNKGASKVAMLGKGTLTVNEGAVLCGAGMLGNKTITLKSGSLMRPGTKESSVSGTIRMDGSRLNINEGATLRFSLSSRSLYTKLTNAGNVVLNGTLKVDVRDGAEFNEGDEFQLWEADNTTLGATMVLKLDTLPEGFAWDTADLASGVLRVALADAIQTPNDAQQTLCVVYNANGVEYTRFSCLAGETGAHLAGLNLPEGIYIVRVISSQGENVTKYVAKRQ